MDAILGAVLHANTVNKRRDHCAIFCGYFFGLRIGETAMLEREDFKDIQSGPATIKTLKQAVRISFVCPCGRSMRVSQRRAGKMAMCSSCNQQSKIPQATREENPLPRKEIVSIERNVRDYITDYMQNAMRPEQRWLFENKAGTGHLCKKQLDRIFGSYVMAAGLDVRYTWHSLRHGRGVFVWDRFENLVMVRELLRQKSLSSAEVYTHLSPQMADKLTAKLEQDGGAASRNPFAKS